MKRASSKSVIIGLSGGVDSSASALVLKQLGYDVQGLFMKNWEEDDTQTYCSAKEDLADVRQICKTLNIPLHTANFSQEYWQRVFSIFLEEYQAGRTPNPDILCNKEIKFKAFLDYAKQLGADYIATGHYARISGEYDLCKGRDNNKDQSYFLYTLGQAALSQSLFPIGDLQKPFVRQMARDAGLITHDKKDSTGICFIGERKFRDFLSEFLPAQPGHIQTKFGEILGTHHGLMYYTLGQRQGLNIGGKKGHQESPWYVVAKDLTQNILIVSQDAKDPWQYSTSLIANQLHWVNEAFPAQTPLQAKVRYRQADQVCHLERLDAQNIRVHFDAPQRAVTPGQSVVFYDEDRCLGGGIIDSTNSPGGLLC